CKLPSQRANFLGPVDEQCCDQPSLLVEVACAEGPFVAVDLDAGPALSVADVLQAEPELVGPEVGRIVVRLVSAEDRGRDGGALCRRARPVLDPDPAAERGPVRRGGVATGVDAEKRGPAARVRGNAAAARRRARWARLVRADAEHDGVAGELAA